MILQHCGHTTRALVDNGNPWITEYHCAECLAESEQRRAEAEVQKVSPTNRYLFAEMADGSVWRIPCEKVAKAGAVEYRSRFPASDEFADEAEFERHALSSDVTLLGVTLIFVHWSDLAPYAVQVRAPQPRPIEEMWREAKVRIGGENDGRE